MPKKDFRPKGPTGRPIGTDGMNEMAGQRDDTRPDRTTGSREIHVFSKGRSRRDQRPQRVIELDIDLDEVFDVEGLEDLTEEEIPDPKASSAAGPADSSTSENQEQPDGLTPGQVSPASVERVNTELRAPVPGLPTSSSPTIAGSPPPPAVVQT